ncbi:helix-turn-helix domain-containing protein [Patescibacteria group bacterium]|nr:helix-turn-helix domain-containing protein [Patescibacteria group bacterium]
MAGEEVGKVIISKGEITPAQMQEIEAGEFLTVCEVADRFRYSYQWVLWMLQEGRIKGIKPLGGRWRIPRSEFDRILKGGIAPMARERPKPPVTEIEVNGKAAEKVKEPPARKQPPTDWFPLDFSQLFGGGKK